MRWTTYAERRNKQIMKNRIVILTGSGAAIPWNGPTTKQITKKIISDRTFKTIEGRPVGEYIYNILEKTYGIADSIDSDDNFDSPNYENIIDIVEYLADYFYSSKEYPIRPRGSILTQLFDVTVDIQNQILDFDKIYEKKKDKRLGYYFVAKHAGETIKFRDEGAFLEAILNRFFEIITGELSYSRWWEIDNKRYEKINSLLKEFIEFYTSKNDIVRYYTVNHDRLAEFATRLPFFNGLVAGGFNLKKVIEDDEVLCHYNLHGSVFFRRDNRGWHCADMKQEQPISFYNSYKNQRGETIFESNITTGLNKISGIMEAPWYHFYHRFYSDCWNADVIYSIGYSFSDIHINKAIENFIGSGNGRFIVIDKIGKVRDKYERQWKISRATRNLSELIKFPHGNIADIQFREPDGNGWIADDDLRLKFYCNGFKKFLSKRQWTTSL